MDYSERLARIAALASGASSLLAVGCALIMQEVGHAFPLSLNMVLIYSSVGLLGAVCLLLYPSLERRHESIQRSSTYWKIMLLVIDIVFVSGLVSYGGGISGPFWVLYFPILIYAGVMLPRAYALMIGVFCSIGLVSGSFQADTAHETTLGMLILVVPLFPIVAGFIGEATAGLSRLRDAARSDRDLLAARIEGLSAGLEQTASGDLTVDPAAALVVDADTAYAEPLQLLSTSLHHTVGNLRNLVGQVRSGGEQIATSAGELLASAEESAAGASQQSSAVTETTSTIEELAATAAQIADTAGSVASAAEETLGLVDEGRQAVESSVESMSRISSRVDDIAARALSLGEQSEEIGRILDVIDDLSDQTNLLALNAAIEAARAGEHGRGFAVVASEVRKLAERSMTATKDIQSIIGSIQAGTSATIMATEDGAREVRAGVELARGAVASLTRITGIVDETTAAAKEISIATQQQRSASDQVVAAMNQVSDVSRQYAAGSRQAAAAAAELNDLASQLRASIAQFTVA